MSLGGSLSDAPAIVPNALQSVIEMVGGDEPEIIVELIDTYLEDSSNQVAQMTPMLVAGDWVTLRRIAHSMKSSSATFGAMVLSKMCETLEHNAKDNGIHGDATAQVSGVEREHVRVLEALRGERTKYVE